MYNTNRIGTLSSEEYQGMNQDERVRWRRYRGAVHVDTLALSPDAVGGLSKTNTTT